MRLLRLGVWHNPDIGKKNNIYPVLINIYPVLSDALKELEMVIRSTIIIGKVIIRWMAL